MMFPRFQCVSLLYISAFAWPLQLVAHDDDTQALPATAAIENHIVQHAEEYGAQEHGERQSEHVNLDGDDEPEIAVLYWLTKHHDTLAYLAIFEQEGDAWRLTDQVYLGGRGLRHVKGFTATEYRIEIEAMEFQGSDPLSSPSLSVTIVITTRHGLLHIERIAQDE